MSGSHVGGVYVVFTVIHLILWAELGVLTRTFLVKFFDLGCQGGWGPCLQGACVRACDSFGKGEPGTKTHTQALVTSSFLFNFSCDGDSLILWV